MSRLPRITGRAVMNALREVAYFFEQWRSSHSCPRPLASVGGALLDRLGWFPVDFVEPFSGRLYLVFSRGPA
jgi:hypothetical protein